ncbi:DUF4245 domain-containing protein [Tessaracoccus antarcticus]|nr:DUF4245 domain-containing protein [Tessaracoccus antarcticus]
MAGRNSNARARDMVLSMLVLLVPLALITWLFTSDPAPEVESVDVASVLAKAEEQSPYPVLRATNLPADWVPVRVAWAADGDAWITNEPAVGNSWQLGYLAPNQIYVAVQQRDRGTATFVSDVTQDGRRKPETSEIAGRSWEHWISDGDRTRSLVWRDGDMVAVVSGDTTFEQLDAFAGTLTTH